MFWAFSLPCPWFVRVKCATFMQRCHLCRSNQVDQETENERVMEQLAERQAQVQLLQQHGDQAAEEITVGDSLLLSFVV